MNKDGVPLYPKRPKKEVKLLKNENIFVRYPKHTFWIGLTVSMLVFFSKPLYDIIAGPIKNPTPYQLRKYKRQRRETSRALDLMFGYTEEEIDAWHKKLDEEERIKEEKLRQPENFNEEAKLSKEQKLQGTIFENGIN